MKTASVFAFAVVGAVAVIGTRSQGDQAKILIGPNVLVSNDGNVTHDEFMLAANPLDPDNLIGVGDVNSVNPGNSKDTKAYVTLDGGRTWVDRNFPEISIHGAGDPEIAFGLRGTAYFLTILGRRPDGPLTFYRSVDKGLTWEQPTILSDLLYGLPTALDHEQIGVDHSFGPYAGRVYFTGMDAAPDETGDMRYRLWLYRSDDDGKTFVGPLLFNRGSHGAGLNVTNTMVSSRGTLYLTYNEWYNDTSVTGAYHDAMTTYLVRSDDGGVTFAPPIRVLAYNGGGHCQWAIDNHPTKYRDRLYYVYDEYDGGKQTKLYLTYSSDGGATWSKSKLVDPTRPADAEQSLPAVTVNAQGVVGIRWFDSRHSKQREGYDEYFTASVDGGETFLPATRISSVTSREPVQGEGVIQAGPLERVARIGIPTWRRTSGDTIRLDFNAAAQGLGHHYYQFTADLTGTFHDFWADSRDGRTRQIYTAAIRVVLPGPDEAKAVADFSKKYGPTPEPAVNLSPKQKTVGRLTKEIFLAIDGAEYDTATSTISFAVRLRNVSDRPLFGPFTVKVARLDTVAPKMVACLEMPPEGKDTNQYCAKTQIQPTVLNATNKVGRAGAEFSYLVEGALLPGQETGPIVWKLRAAIPRNTTKDEGGSDATQRTIWFPSRLAALVLEVTGYRGPS